MLDKKRAVAVVTGATRGIGLATAELLYQNGYDVYGMARRPTAHGQIKMLACDVSDEESVKAAFAEVLERAGGIDLLVNCAGFGISGAVEFTESSDARAQFDVNFFGDFHCIKAVLPYMRAHGGRIVNVSSVAGVISIPFQAFYSASKAAVNSLTLALRNELRPFGVKVSALMPGDVKTGFTAARTKDTRGEAIYAAQKRSVELMEQSEQNGLSPEEMAACILNIAKAKNPKPLYVGGDRYKKSVLKSKLLPTEVMNNRIGRMYAQ